MCEGHNHRCKAWYDDIKTSEDEGKLKKRYYCFTGHFLSYPGSYAADMGLDPLPEAYIEFKIKDSGMGIPEDQKDKIFMRFSRAGNAVEAKTPGSGLGLSIAKDIIEKYHGKIWFESKENEGSSFFFSLPIGKG